MRIILKQYLESEAKEQQKKEFSDEFATAWIAAKGPKNTVIQEIVTAVLQGEPCTPAELYPLFLFISDAINRRNVPINWLTDPKIFPKDFDSLEQKASDPNEPINAILAQLRAIQSGFFPDANNEPDSDES